MTLEDAEASGKRIPALASASLRVAGHMVLVNAQGKRRRSTEGAEGTNKGHENAEGMALVCVRLTAQLSDTLVALRLTALT